MHNIRWAQHRAIVDFRQEFIEIRIRQILIQITENPVDSLLNADPLGGHGSCEISAKHFLNLKCRNDELVLYCTSEAKFVSQHVVADGGFRDMFLIYIDAEIKDADF